MGDGGLSAWLGERLPAPGTGMGLDGLSTGPLASVGVGRGTLVITCEVQKTDGVDYWIVNETLH